MHSTSENRPTDIASVNHWESVWKHTDSVHKFSSLNYYDFRLSEIFKGLAAPGSKVIEIGCGGSRWISYFDRIAQCEIWGIDYSPEGLQMVEHSNANRPNVHLVRGDFFDDSLLPREYFDLVYSLGFIEHFTESTVVVQRIADVLRPGGKVVTLIPNFIGPYGKIQSFVNRTTFDKHVLLDRQELDRAHLSAGMESLLPAYYCGCFGPGVVDYGRWQSLILAPLKLVQHLTCWTLHALHLDFESRLSSPYIVGVYQKPKSL
jgi:SAM-dependent methyltransferase